MASILCVSIFLSFPFLPVPCPFPSLFLFPCSISFLFFLFLVLSNSLCPALFLLSLFTLPLPETDRKSKKLQNPPVFSKNHRIIVEQSSKNHPQPTFSGPNPLHSGQESKKLQNPPVFFSKIIETSSKNHPQPTFSGPTPLHSGQESKKLQNPPVVFSKKTSKNHRTMFEKSSKNHRTIFEQSSKNHPQPTFSGPTPLHSGQESKKLQNPPVFFSKIIEKSSKNHRTIFEQSSNKSSKNHPDRHPSSKNHPTNYPAYHQPSKNHPPYFPPLFSSLEHDLKRASTQPPSDISCAKWLQLNCFMAEAEGNPPKQAKQSQAQQIKAKQSERAKQSKAKQSERSKAKQSKASERAGRQAGLRIMKNDEDKQNDNLEDNDKR